MRPSLRLLAILALAASLSPAQNATGGKPIRTADIYVRGLKPSDFPRMTKLAPNVYVYQAFQVMPNIEHVFITNCFVVVTSDGVLIGDALETEEDVRALIAAVAKVTPQPIKYVVIGADHIDHTGGDLQVYVPGENILFMSESYFNRLFPSMATGYPSEWAAMLKKAEAMNARITIPGHGFIDSPQVLKEELVNYRLAVEKIVSEGNRLHDSKVPLESAPRVSVLGMFQYWTRAAQNLPDDFRRVYMEADGLLK